MCWIGVEGNEINIFSATPPFSPHPSYVMNDTACFWDWGKRSYTSLLHPLTSCVLQYERVCNATVLHGTTNWPHHCKWDQIRALVILLAARSILLKHLPALSVIQESTRRITRCRGDYLLNLEIHCQFFLFCIHHTKMRHGNHRFCYCTYCYYPKTVINKYGIFCQSV